MDSFDEEEKTTQWPVKDIRTAVSQQSWREQLIDTVRNNLLKMPSLSKYIN